MSEVGPVGQELQEYLEQLRGEGWQIVREPGPQQVPSSLRTIRVDFLARRDVDIIVVEVANRSTARRERIDAIAKRVADIPNARLEVFWIGDTPITKPAAENVQRYIDVAKTVSEVSLQAALVMALAAFEGAVATFADEVDTELQAPARQLLASLYSLGFVEEADYHRLSALYKLRDEIVHSLTSEVPTPDDVRFCLDLASRLLEGRYISADQMTEWFKEHYEAPEHRVPHDSSEGGYQYAPNEPYYAEEILREEFPYAPNQTITEAVDWLENESFDWVRKPGFEG
jgi:hypothetical protein